MDPTANPSLFQSTLVIIIKVGTPRGSLLCHVTHGQDVVESDKAEIARE